MPLGFGPCLDAMAPRLTRTLVNRAALREVPKPRVFPPVATNPAWQISTPREFLTVIGRSCQEKIEPESWDAFWRTTRHDMKKAGLGAKERRYCSHLASLAISGALTSG